MLSPIAHLSALLMDPVPRKRLILAGGGGGADPPEMRDQVISLWENGADLKYSLWIAELREQKLFPCWRSCRQWISSFINEGTTLRKRATGNRI